MTDLTWLPYVIAAVIIALVAWFTFRRVPQDAEGRSQRRDPPR